MPTTKYFIFPAGKPEEKFEVLPHTSNEEYIKFANANLAGGDGSAFINAETTYKFENLGMDGVFVNNDVQQLDVTGTFDIVREEVEVEIANE